MTSSRDYQNPSAPSLVCICIAHSLGFITSALQGLLGIQRCCVDQNMGEGHICASMCVGGYGDRAFTPAWTRAAALGCVYLLSLLYRFIWRTVPWLSEEEEKSENPECGRRVPTPPSLSPFVVSWKSFGHGSFSLQTMTRAINHLPLDICMGSSSRISGFMENSSKTWTKSLF